MTYHSGWINVVKGGATQPLESGRQGLEAFGRLQKGLNEQALTQALLSWAKENGRDPDTDIHWIDNCWFQVAVTAAELADFLHWLTAAPWAKELALRIDPADSYVVVAEEY